MLNQDQTLLTPEQQQEEKLMNQEALAILQSEDFKTWSLDTLKEIRDQMEAKLQECKAVGMNCLGVVALRNKASQVIRGHKLQEIIGS